MKLKTPIHFSFVALLLFLTTTVCHAGFIADWAQEARGTLQGQVTDPQGAVIPHASVVITSEDTKVKQETTANGQGSWRVPFLNPGTYVVTVSAPGFKVAEQRGITLQTADIKQIDLRLEVGTESERVGWGEGFNILVLAYCASQLKFGR